MSAKLWLEIVHRNSKAIEKGKMHVYAEGSFCLVLLRKTSVTLENLQLQPMKLG